MTAVVHDLIERLLGGVGPVDRRARVINVKPLSQHRREVDGDDLDDDALIAITCIELGSGTIR